MDLPRIKIDFLSGQLGKVGTSSDGLVAILCGATAVKKTFELGKAYELRGFAELEKLGVTTENNPRLTKHVKEFYAQAKDGTKVVICGVDKARTLTEICEKEQGELRTLIEGKNGELRAVFIGLDSAEVGQPTEGLSADVFTALPKAQAVAEWATEQLYAPLFVVLEGRGYTTGEGLRDLTKETHNRVAVLVGDTEANSVGSALGILAGRVASVPVQRNVGRVRDGALKVDAFYLGADAVEQKNTAVMNLHEKGYITLRKYVGRTGYFFTDDYLATSYKDDYSGIAPRRVIDKAYRIAYDALLDNLLDEISLNEDGTMQPAVVKSWQQSVENAINMGMTANGELSAMEGDACKCYIDETQNIASTSRIEMTLLVRPHGYARYIDVALGFNVSSANAE